MLFSVFIKILKSQINFLNLQNINNLTCKIMKKSRIAILVIFATFFIASCDELLDNLLDVEQSFSFTIELPVNAEDSEFIASEVFNLSDEVDLIDEYGDLIKEVNVDHIYFRILEYEGDIDVTVDGGVLYVMEADGSNSKLITSLGEINLMDLIEDSLELELNEEGVNLLGELATNPPHAFMLHYELQLDEADLPVIFVAEFEFGATMVASPLND